MMLERGALVVVKRGRTVSERHLKPKQWLFDPDDDPTPPGATGPPPKVPDHGNPKLSPRAP